MIYLNALLTYVDLRLLKTTRALHNEFPLYALGHLYIWIYHVSVYIYK